MEQGRLGASTALGRAQPGWELGELWGWGSAPDSLSDSLAQRDPGPVWAAEHLGGVRNLSCAPVSQTWGVGHPLPAPDPLHLVLICGSAEDLISF